MTDEQVQPQDGNTGTSDTQDGSELEAQLNSPDVPQWVRDMITNVNARAAGYRAKLREVEEKASLAERQKLAEKEQYKELAASLQAELDKLKPQVDAAQAMREEIAAANKARIEALPEKLRTIVPDIDDPVKLQKWLDASAAVLQAPRIPDMDAGIGGDQGKNLALTPEELAIAQRMNISPEKMLAQKRQLQGERPPAPDKKPNGA